ncbi:MAG TPA: tetratricopeptide repeat protein [Candidatus Acidoferrum sp.]|jgi:tetratricopeptide (TPR) repeat protein
MSGLNVRPQFQFRLAFILLGLLTTSTSVSGQRTPPVRSQGPGVYNPPQSVSVRVNVRDERGTPLGVPAIVHLRATVGGFNSNLPTRDGSAAEFPGVLPGQYEIEVRCVGYKTTSEQLTVASMGTDISVFVYIRSESDTATGSSPASGVVMSPKLQAEIDKGFDALRRNQYEAAKLHFAKAVKIAPSNVDTLYLLGTAELSLHQTDLAREHFEVALKLNPSYEKALLAIGEMQVQSGDTTGAITTLEKAFDLNGASWRTHLLLASAYAKAGRLEDAENHAQRAATLAKEKGAYPTFLLGEILDAEGKSEEARSTWEVVLARFPNDAIALKAKEKLAQPSAKPANDAKSETASLPPPLPLPVVLLPPVVERSWAPPDVDSMEYRLASNAPCKSDEVLAGAQYRMSMQLENFEKFTATERIEHQQIDRYGMPGPPLTRQFSYIVFVHSFKEDSVYLEESRNGASDTSGFPTSLATIGLNGLGVSILQPANQKGFIYKCEGLTNVRGEAAWQIRFQENTAAAGFTGVREWRKKGMLYDIPIKGRIWVASSSFDLLRVETDLIAPIDKLELSRDHLTVDYGPVSFQSGSAKLWLPWTAEMYMEVHGKRYHHKHLLTDYMLFEVDTSNKVHKPKQAPPAEAEPGN